MIQGSVGLRKPLTFFFFFFFLFFLSSSSRRLSERNCIEIIAKLIQEKKLDVVHTLDGKEYITPAQISREIRDELYVHGGQWWNHVVSLSHADEHEPDGGRGGLLIKTRMMTESFSSCVFSQGGSTLWTSSRYVSRVHMETLPELVW